MKKNIVIIFWAISLRPNSYCFLLFLFLDYCFAVFAFIMIGQYLDMKRSGREREVTVSEMVHKQGLEMQQR